MSEPKRFKHDCTSLEQLPNEIFVEIFGCLNGVDTLYAFLQLNNRFQCLLNNYVDTFDFMSISKAKFDFVTRHHDIHRWRSLRLSDDDRTPGQIKLFCQLFPPAEYLSQLQSLSVVNMRKNYGKEVFSLLRSFDNLVSLIIGKICGHYLVPIALPLLNRLVVTSCGQTFWMTKFPRLENLEYVIEGDCDRICTLKLPTTLKQLKLFYKEEEFGDAVRTSLRSLSELTKLSLYNIGNDSSWPNGRIWAELIEESLPLLTTFQFCFPLPSHGSTSGDINAVVESFSTPFYVIEKGWFIQCDYTHDNCRVGTLYSLPFAFAMMPINVRSFNTSMQTLPTRDLREANSDSDVYAKVNTLVFNERCESPNHNFAASNILRLVLNDTLTTNWFHLLTKLSRLEIKNNVIPSATHFSDLLTTAPQLKFLTIPIRELENLTDNFMNDVVCRQLSQQIRSLTLSVRSFDTFNIDAVTAQFLSPIIRIFGETLEHLSLGILEHPKDVLPILRRMQQLRSLCIDLNSWCYRSPSMAKYWLQEQSTVPTATLNFVHITDTYKINYYEWFGNRL